MKNDIIDSIRQQLEETKPKSKVLKDGRISLWVVFRVVAKLGFVEYDASNANLTRLKHLASSNWWHNGSAKAVNKGHANDELRSFIQLCNETLKEQDADYRIPEDIFFDTLPASLDEIINRIQSYKPKKDSVFIEIDHKKYSEAVGDSFSKSKLENYAECKVQLNHFLTEVGHEYAILFGASEQSVSQYLYSYTNSLSGSGALSTRSLNIIYFNVSKVAKVSDFIEKLTEKLLERGDKTNSQESIEPENKLKQLSKLLSIRDDGYVLVLTGLNKSLMSSSVTQSLSRSLRDDDLCRLLVKLVNNTIGANSSKLSKIILGVRDVSTSIRAEFAEARQIILHSPTQLDWETDLEAQDNCPITLEISKNVSRISIKPSMIDMLMKLEKLIGFIEDRKKLELWQLKLKQKLISAIENNCFGIGYCEFLLSFIAQEKSLYLRFLKCIALSDVGLSGSSMIAINGMLYESDSLETQQLKETIERDVASFIKDLGPLLSQYVYVYKRGEEKLNKDVFELDSNVRELLLEYWRLEKRDIEHFRIHHAIACRSIYIAAEYDSQYRRYQALIHIVRAVSDEYCKSNVGPCRLTLKRALVRIKTLNSKIKTANESGVNIEEVNRELVQIAWVYYFHLIEKQQENHKEEGIFDGENWHYEFDKFRQKSASSNPIVKGAMLRCFASLGLAHSVNHFYLPEILVKGLRQRQLLDYLGAYSVNAYNRLDYSDLEKCVATYHQVFSKFAHESQEQALNLALHQNSVHLFARESMSRPTICHLRRLFDQGKVRRVREFCDLYTIDIDKLLDCALITYLELKEVLAQQQNTELCNDENYNRNIELKLLGKLKEFIRKLLKRRIRFEAILLKVYCQQAKWVYATQTALNVYEMSKDAYENLLNRKKITTKIDLIEHDELLFANPKLKNNRPLIHCMEYFICFNIFSTARFAESGDLIDVCFSERIIEQGVKQYYKAVGQDITTNIDTSIWYQMKKAVKEKVESNTLSDKSKDEDEANQKFDDNSILKLLRTQYNFVGDLDHATESIWNKFVGEKRSCIDKDLDPASEYLSQQMKLQLEVALFKVETYEVQNIDQSTKIERLMKIAEQLILVLEEKTLSFWLVDMLLMYCEIIKRFLQLRKQEISNWTDGEYRKEYQSHVAKRDKALIKANQLIEKTHYHYRDLDLVAQQFSDKIPKRLPILVR